MKVLAFDLGASSGRGIILTYDGNKIDCEEIYRFRNEPVNLFGHMYWDFPRICREILNGLVCCANSGHGDISAIGIDTWGVDYGLLDKDGDLLGMIYHYRDVRTNGIEAEIEKKLGMKNIFLMSGIQNIWFNTSYQLCSMKKFKPEVLALAKRMMMLPDLIAYFLTGVMKNEYTAAATTQLYNISERKYDERILRALELPENIFPDEVIYPGETIGYLKTDIAAMCGLSQDIPVIASACHDTASAVTAVPSAADDFIFVSCGTWSLLGTVLDSPILNDAAYAEGFSNEGMPEGKIKFLKNIMGLWIIQECRNLWLRRGEKLSFDDFEKAASESVPFRSFIDVEDTVFSNPGSMENAIQEYCRVTGQFIPETKGEIIRCVYESLAMKYRYSVERLEDLTEKKFEKIYMIGGGCRDNLLCSFTANASGKEVISGPAEATALGNGINQFIGLGVIHSVSEGREILCRSIDTGCFCPRNTETWDKAYDRYIRVIGKNN